MCSPDHALLFDRLSGIAPPAAALLPLLERHGIVRRSSLRSEFTDWCVRILMHATASGETAPHRFWPSAKGGVYLAILPWQGDSVFAIQFYEEPDPSEEQQRLARLTPREIEVLSWICEGKDNVSIATILDISHATTRKHVQNIFEKLMCENRTAAAKYYTDSWERYRQH